MNIEDIVPPLELCKKIPDGAFADSAFIWRDIHGNIVYQDVFPRGCGDYCDLLKLGAILAPAPTLEEILSDFNSRDIYAHIETDNQFENTGRYYLFCYKRGEYPSQHIKANGAAEAALKAWLIIKLKDWEPADGGKN